MRGTLKIDYRGSPCADTSRKRTNQRYEPISSTAPSDKTSVLFFFGGNMEYDTTGMDVDYVQSLYPTVKREILIRTMVQDRTCGYPREVGIIRWFHSKVVENILLDRIFGDIM